MISCLTDGLNASGRISVDRSMKVDASNYARLVADTADSLIYNTPEWLRFLSISIAEAEPVLLLASQDGQPVGGFVAFLRRGPLGVALNALPYFGSHGDFVISSKATDPCAVEQALVEGVAALLREADVRAVNIVAHPRSPHIGASAARLGLTAWDQRIGQISMLTAADSRVQAMEAVLAACTQKTRNIVRKAVRQGFAVERSEHEADWTALSEHHRLGMERIGGRAKSPEEFAALRACFVSQEQRRLYVARRDRRFAGGLLCFYYRDWVEYFTPVAVEDFRHEQVLSALIVEALIDARLEGRRFWNWGGTWTSQTGVYHFKRGWGAVDHVYDYHGAASGPMTEAAPDELRAGYPFFYIRPFSSETAAPMRGPSSNVEVHES